MAGYRRFVAYVYEYPDGKKGNGKGFIKVEARDGKCRMNYRIQGIYGKEEAPCKIYGFVRKSDGCEGIYLGECDLAGDTVQFQTEVPDQGLGGTAYGLNDLSGLVMLTQDGIMYGTGWDDRPVRLEEIRLPRMQAERPQNADRTSDRKNNVQKEALETEQKSVQDELAEGVAAAEALMEAEEPAGLTGEEEPLFSGENPEACLKLPEDELEEMEYRSGTTAETETDRMDSSRADRDNGMDSSRADRDNDMNINRAGGGNGMNTNRANGSNGMNTDRADGDNGMNVNHTGGSNGMNVNRADGGNGMNTDRTDGDNGMNVNHTGGSNGMNTDRADRGNGMNVNRADGGNGMNTDRTDGDNDMNVNRADGGNDMNTDRADRDNGMNVNRADRSNSMEGNRAETGNGIGQNYADRDNAMDGNRADGRNAMEEDWEAGNNPMGGNRAQRENAMEADWEAGNNPMGGYPSSASGQGGMNPPDTNREQRSDSSNTSRWDWGYPPIIGRDNRTSAPDGRMNGNRSDESSQTEERARTVPSRPESDPYMPPRINERGTYFPQHYQEEEPGSPQMEQNREPVSAVPNTEQSLDTTVPDSEMRIEDSGSTDSAEQSTWNPEGDREEDEVNVLEELDQDEDAIRNMRQMEREVTEKNVQKQEKGELHEQSAQAAAQPAVFEPFSDGEIVDCRQITPAEMRILARRDRGLMNNNFLRHGYYRYHYLLLGRRRDDGRYILGVPGVYDRQECLMAGMFGFPNFKAAKTQGKAAMPRFGYWYRLIDTPDINRRNRS